jgi:hypothetical protein
VLNLLTRNEQFDVASAAVQPLIDTALNSLVTMPLPDTVSQPASVLFLLKTISFRRQRINRHPELLKRLEALTTASLRALNFK